MEILTTIAALCFLMFVAYRGFSVILFAPLAALFAVAWVCDRPSVSIRRHRFMKLGLGDLIGLGEIGRAHV